MPDGQYFEREPVVASAPHHVQLALPDVTLSLTTDRGVFSGARVDPGTKVLLTEVPAPPRGRLLDLGCGYGPIACTLAKRSPEAEVWAVDVNERAVALTEANARTAGLDNVRALTPGAVPSDVRFDAIFSNPPIRIGKRALHELLSTWLPRLAPDGRAWLVVQKHLGSDSLAAWLQQQGWPVRRRVSKIGYRVLEVSACAT